LRPCAVLGASLTLIVAARPVDAATGPSSTFAVPPRAPIDWATMSRKDRKAYMKSVILPKAQALFSAFDPKEFKIVTCATCHGEGHIKGTYRMPCAELPMLPASPEGFKQLEEQSPEITTFMRTQVKPTMAALLGLPELSSANPKGFTCFNCHTKRRERPPRRTEGDASNARETIGR